MSKKQNGKHPPQLKGGLGGSSGPLIPETVEDSYVDQRTPGKDLRTIQAAVSRGWQIRPAAMSALPDAMLRIALDSDMQTRARVSAAKVIVAMHGQNEPAPVSTVNVGVSMNAAEAVKAALNEPDYIRYVHARRSADAGDLCLNGHGGSLPAATSHNGDRRGNNGHHHGENGKHASN